MILDMTGKENNVPKELLSRLCCELRGANRKAKSLQSSRFSKVKQRGGWKQIMSCVGTSEWFQGVSMQ